ncbi:MAG: hypothetical protein ACFFFT_12635 [Candidatus Thorarchaeota archaeon]
MKRRTVFIGLFLCNILLFISICGFSTAKSDTDGDGIDDKFEELNKREIDLVIEANEISIESISKNDERKDLISTNIVYDEDGLRFQIGYKPTLESDFTLLFGISFRELIEFVDTDLNGIYNPEVDPTIQNFSIGEFIPHVYENSTYPSGSVLHHFQIQTENKTFTAHIYFAEEFVLLEDTLLLPTQARINIEISNFTYLNSSSQLALYTRLDSEAEYQIQENTEDEKYGYAENEQGAITSLENLIGFFTWNNIAKIDNASKNVLISGIVPDTHEENTDMLFINYPYGIQINHYSKIGFQGLLIFEKTTSFLPIVIFVLILGALSVVALYSIYHYKKHKLPSHIQKRPGEDDYLEFLEDDDFDYLFDSSVALQILQREGAIEKLYHKGDINITAISADFYEIINQFGFKESEKQEFVKEMLSLSPKERELILKEMRIKSQ